MKTIFQIFAISFISISVFAQNSITTPATIPLTIGNNGVKLANLNSSSTPSAFNGLGLSVDGTGNIILTPSGTKLANITSASTPSPFNGLGLSVDASGNFLLVPSGTKLASITSLSPPSLPNNLGLSVDATGNIILVPSSGSPSYRVFNTTNTFGGTNSGLTQTYGSLNTFLGYGSGQNSNTTSSPANPSENSQNTFIGFSSGYYNTTGYFNTYIGSNAGQINQTGINSVMIGRSSGWNGIITTPQNVSYSTFIGANTGAKTNADFNTFIGFNAGAHNTSGNNNTFIGTYAGAFNGQTNNTYCTFIGEFAGPWSGTDPGVILGSPNNSLVNANAIGYQAQCIVSNGLVLGGVGANAVKVGIGLNNPAYPLDVKGVVNMRITQNLPAIKINERDFMGIGENEEFWVSNFKIRYENENQWSDKVFEKDYKLLKINELEEFVNKNKHLPNIPSAKDVVQKGIDNAEITSKLLEKIEEMSLYIIQLEKRISEIEKK